MIETAIGRNIFNVGKIKKIILVQMAWTEQNIMFLYNVKFIQMITLIPEQSFFLQVNYFFPNFPGRLVKCVLNRHIILTDRFTFIVVITFGHSPNHRVILLPAAQIEKGFIQIPVYLIVRINKGQVSPCRLFLSQNSVLALPRKFSSR